MSAMDTATASQLREALEKLIKQLNEVPGKVALWREKVQECEQNIAQATRDMNLQHMMIGGKDSKIAFDAEKDRDTFIKSKTAYKRLIDNELSHESSLLLLQRQLVAAINKKDSEESNAIKHAISKQMSASIDKLADEARESLAKWLCAKGAIDGTTINTYTDLAPFVAYLNAGQLIPRRTEELMQEMIEGMK